jgi:uncharacterized protein (DUF433 family)
MALRAYGTSMRTGAGYLVREPTVFEKGLFLVINREELLERISIGPQVCFGKPCIRGTRIWVSLIVDNLVEGVPEADLLAAYPQLQPEDIRAALAFAAEMTRERIIPIPVEAGSP